MWITPKKSDYMYIVVTSTIKIVEVDSYVIDRGNHAEWVLLTVFQKLQSLQPSHIFWVQSFEPNKQHKLLFLLFEMFNITLLQWYIYLVNMRLGKFQYCLLFTHQYCTSHPFAI